MYVLYTVSSCGHLACYTCLKSWFLNAPPLPPLLSGDNEDVRKVEGEEETVSLLQGCCGEPADLSERSHGGREDEWVGWSVLNLQNRRWGNP